MDTCGGGLLCAFGIFCAMSTCYLRAAACGARGPACPQRREGYDRQLPKDHRPGAWHRGTQMAAGRPNMLSRSFTSLNGLHNKDLHHALAPLSSAAPARE